jgi:hypothetical protein
MLGRETGLSDFRQVRFSSIKKADGSAPESSAPGPPRPQGRPDGEAGPPPPKGSHSTRRKSPGRPQRKPEEGPKVQVGFQVTSVERDHIREAASQAGLSVSEFLRRRALGRPVVPLADAAARKALRRVGVNLNQLVRRANAGGAVEAEARAVIAEVRAAVARVGRPVGSDPKGGTS